MKILHVIASVSLRDGGPSFAVLEMAKHLTELGVEADIVTTNDASGEFLQVETGRFLPYRGAPRVIFFPFIKSTFKALNRYKVSFETVKWLHENLKNYELVHIHGLFTHPTSSAMSLCRKMKVPYIIRPLGHLTLWSLKQSALRKKIYLALGERKGLFASRALHFTSDLEKKEAAENGICHESFVLPLGIKEPAIKTHKRERQNASFNLLFLGRLHPKKGLESTLKALNSIKHLDFHFNIAGEGTDNYVNSIKAMISGMGLQEKVSLKGFVEGEQKTELLQQSDLFILNSYSENFGLAVLEALAAGLPVAVSSNVAMAETLEDEKIGFVISEGNLSQTLENCMAKRNELQEMGEKAQTFVFKEYGWPRIVPKLAEFYKQYTCSGRND